MAHTCPRRIEDGTAAPSALRGSGEDRDTYIPGHGLIGQASGCSYCGSMDPEDFMAAVRNGAEVGPTDKSYKVYVDGSKGKFYFQHLSPEQRTEFVDLLNTGSVNIGYPGYFYILPFFIRKAGRATV